MAIPKSATPGHQQKVHTSATVMLKANNKVIGVGQDATGTENYNVIPVAEGFGSIMPLEHVITEWSATVSMNKFYLRSNSLVEMGIAPSGEGILRLPPINIEFVDSLDNANSLTVFSDCTLQTREFTVTQNQIVGERATWVALNIQGVDPFSPKPAFYGQ